MVFSDPKFLFLFLPIAFLIFHAVRIWGSGAMAIGVLVVLSCIFYAYWSVTFLFLLLGQIIVNYHLGYQLQSRPRRGLLSLAVIFNLCLLGYFKYRNFFLETWVDIAGTHVVLSHLIVPLAISFHTFQQIALLVDIKDEEAELPPLLNYVFFVMFFPQLIAGPIVLHREMGRQVEGTRAGNNPGFAYIGAGLFLFIFGLFKKVFLADKLAPLVDIAFTPHLDLTFPESWTAAIAYALQLYFDFSGYSDMAVGLGLLFGFRLPNNFLVPFRATSMIEYWKRWHITMTRFFTMYTYMPVAVAMSRFTRAKGVGKIGSFVLTITLPTMVAFLASGLWHGAGWTFIMFGVANGAGLVINHLWKSANAPKLPRFLAWSLTAVTVLITLVYFRSTTLGQAHSMLHTMFIPHAFGAPPWLAAHLPGWHLPVTSYEWFNYAAMTLQIFEYIAVLGVLSVLLPAYAAQADKVNPTVWKATATAAMLWLAFGVLDQPRSFIYFAF